MTIYAVRFDPTLIDTFAGIAGSLYGEIGGADDKRLENSLNGIIDRYFPMGFKKSAPGLTAGSS